MPGLFAEFQPRYAEHGIATFPVNDNKRPAVAQYLRMGLPASGELVARFTEADALGFVCGSRSGITVLDIDSPDERLLADALKEHGHSPFIVRSGSGNFQAWYKHSGEGRSIRPDESKPIDILGGGYVVAPPSRSAKGDYSIIAGSLDDLANLPPMVSNSSGAVLKVVCSERLGKGQRNELLWRECMKYAGSCRTVEKLTAFATKANRTLFYEPLSDDEVSGIVASAWTKETSGENFFGRGGSVIIQTKQIDQLLGPYPDAFILLLKLRRHHWGRDFACANAMAGTMPGGGWTVKRFSGARQKLEELDEIEQVRPPSKFYGPAIYRFKGGQK